jgi:hypothetical protein
VPYSASGQYFPPAVRYTLGKPAPEFISRPQRTFPRVATGAGMTKGRTNGMPWNGTAPCTVGTDPVNRDHDATNLARIEAYLHVVGDKREVWR